MQPDRDTVMVVLHRDSYRCVRCAAIITGERGMHWSLHHRQPRGMGGAKHRDGIHSPANLLTVCGAGNYSGCHGYIEQHRGEAVEAGWIVSRYSDPAVVAVLVDRQSRWVHLTHDGRYESEMAPAGEVG